MTPRARRGIPFLNDCSLKTLSLSFFPFNSFPFSVNISFVRTLIQSFNFSYQLPFSPIKSLHLFLSLSLSLSLLLFPTHSLPCSPTHTHNTHKHTRPLDLLVCWSFILVGNISIQLTIIIHIHTTFIQMKINKYKCPEDVVMRTSPQKWRQGRQFIGVRKEVSRQ